MLLQKQRVGLRSVGVPLAFWPWLVLCSVLGCATAGINRDELPEHPIAVTYWDSGDARRRAEIVAEAKEKKQGPRREGVAHLEHLGALVGLEEAAGERELSRYPGYLALVDPRTARVERVHAAPAGSRALSWSNDGRRLMFATKHTRESSHLFEYDLDTQEVSRLTLGREAHITGGYGPDDRIAYFAVLRQGRKFRSRVYVTPGRGERGEVVSEGIQTDSLAWSHQGGALVFVQRQRMGSSKAARPFLLSRAPEVGASAKRIAPGRDPVLTRDGRWVVYAAPVGESWRLHRVRPDGSGRTSMGKGVVDELDPAVSPDGRFVAYVSHADGEPDNLFVRRFDGTGDRVLLGAGAVAHPVW
jgi:Tol biopolymer transport system component